MRSIGLPELLVVVIVGLFIGGFVVILPMWKIFAKAGYPGALSVLTLIPLVNIVMMYYLGFSDWPVLKELQALRNAPRA